MRIMQGNMNLIKEINELRQQQQSLKLQQQEASVLGGGGEGAGGMGMGMGRPPLHGGGMDAGNPAEIIATQQDQLQSLRMQIAKLEQAKAAIQQPGAGAGGNNQNNGDAGGGGAPVGGFDG
jgi:DNA repair exonuclease SbcCD ATPase subunit